MTLELGGLDDMAAGTSHQAELLSPTGDQGQAPISASGSLQAFAAVLAPGTLVCALMYYFGWVRTHSLYAFFGIDADELGLSTTDYVLRSADALWPALVGIVVTVLLFLLAHGVVSHWIGDARHARRLQRLLVLPLGAAGATLSSLGVVRLLTAQRASIATPLSLALGLGLLAYSRFASRRLLALRDQDRAPRQRSRQLDLAVFGLFILLIVLNVFWVTALFAEDLGQGRAERLEAQEFVSQPDVLLYTRDRLHVDARDVDQADLGPAYAPYRFRYDGLKLLVRGNGRLILIPYSWSTSNAFALVLPDGDDVRIVFAPHF
jgi:uncharacterized membrane protein